MMLQSSTIRQRKAPLFYSLLPNGYDERGRKDLYLRLARQGDAGSRKRQDHAELQLRHQRPALNCRLRRQL